MTFERAYNGIANGLLWFTAHLLWATPVSPSFDERTRREWGAFGYAYLALPESRRAARGFVSAAQERIFRPGVVESEWSPSPGHKGHRIGAGGSASQEGGARFSGRPW